MHADLERKNVVKDQYNKKIAEILGWKHSPGPASGHPTRTVRWEWKAPDIPDPKDPTKTKSGMRRKDCPDFCGKDKYILKREFRRAGLILTLQLHPDGLAMGDFCHPNGEPDPLRKVQSDWK